MATLLGDAVVRVRPDLGNFQSETQSGVSRALGAVSRSAKVALGAVTAAGTAAAISAVKTGVAYNDLEQKSKAAFTTILGTQEAAAKMMGDIREFGKTSPFPRQAFIAATQQLLGFGYEADQIIPILSKINDTTAAVGGNAETIATLSDVFAKIKVNGKISGEEINRLGAVGINALEAISDQSGLTGKALQKAISKGTIGSEVALASLEKYMGRFAGASENVKNTWSGAIDRVKGAWRDFSSALVEPFISKGGGGIALKWANGLADGLRKAANVTPGLIALLTTGNYDGALSQFGIFEDSKVVDGILRVRDATTGLFDLLTKGDYTGALQRAFGWSEDGAAVDGILRVRDAASGLYKLLVEGDYTGALQRAFGWEEDSTAVGALFALRDAVGQVGDAIKAAFSGDLDGAKAKLGEIPSMLEPLGPAFDNLGEVAKKLGPALGDAAATVGGAFGDSLKVAGGLLGFLADHIDVIVKLLPVAVGAWVAYSIAVQATNAWLIKLRAAQVLSSLSTFASLRTTQAQTAALVANAAALNGVTIAEQRKMMAEAAAQRTTIRGTITSGVASVKNVALAISTAAVTAATWAATAAQTAFAVAMNASIWPILAIIAGIALLVGGIILLWKHNETFRNIVKGAWEGIKSAVSSTVDWLTGTAWPAIKAVWDGIKDGALWLWNEGIKPAFNWIKAAFQDVASTIKSIWDGWLFPVFDLIGAIVKWLAVNVFKAYLWLIKKEWELLTSAIKWAWDNILKPTWDAIASAAVWLWDSVLKPVIGWIKDGWGFLVDGIAWAWNNVLKPAWDGIASAARWLWDSVLSPVFGWIGDRWDALLLGMKVVWEGILKPIFEAVMDFIENKVKGAFERGVDAIGKAWDTLKDKAKEPVRFLIDTIINGGIVDNFNKLADFFGTKPMARVPLPKGFATGGYTGAGGKHDPAGVVHKGEYVFTQEQTNRIGLSRLAQIARNGYADGGLVDLGRQLISKGFRVGEHPAFGKVGTHSKNSQHYVGNAIDVNYGPGGENDIEKRAIDGIVGWIKSQGFPVLWRTKGHFDHLHVSGRKGMSGPLGKIGEFFSGAWDSLTSFTQPFTDVLGKLGDAVLDNPMGELIKGGATKLIDGVKSWVTDKASGLLNFGGSSSGEIGDWAGAQGKLSPADARAAAKSMLPPGWSWDALNSLWSKESGWSWSADNPSSSAYGIPQALPGRKMSSAGADWATNAVTQIKWGLGYIADRYGNSQSAWAHSQQKNWYDWGGLANGVGVMQKETLRPERVLSPRQTAAFEDWMRGSHTAQTSSAVVENLTINLGSGGSPRDALQETNFQLRRIRRGGVHARSI